MPPFPLDTQLESTIQDSCFCWSAKVFSSKSSGPEFSALSDSFTYDPQTNRMTQYQFTVNGSSLTGVLGWNANGTLKTQNITDPFNGANTQNCSYGYDDLIRLTSANCGGAAAQTFSYGTDGSGAFGNVNKSGSPYSFTPTYSSATNRMTNINGFTPTYDNNGNVLNDNSHTYAWDSEGRPATIDSVNLQSFSPSQKSLSS